MDDVSALSAAELVGKLSEEVAGTFVDPYCDYRGAPDATSFPKPPQWATYCEGRAPKFKAHSTLGQAKNALSGRTLGTGGRYTEIKGRRTYERPMESGWVYESVGGVWTLRWSVAEGTYKSEHPLWS